MNIELELIWEEAAMNFVCVALKKETLKRKAEAFKARVGYPINA
jgi:hypothetical protein